MKVTQHVILPERTQGLREDQITRMNGREMAGLLSMGGANALLRDNVPAGLERRLKRLGLWWRYKGLLTQLENLQATVEESAEDEQRATVALRVRHLNVFVGMDAVKDPNATWIRIPDLNVLCGAVLEDTCGLCTATAAEAHRCAVRAALLSSSTVDRSEFKPGANGCPFGGMNLLGETEGLDID